MSETDPSQTASPTPETPSQTPIDFDAGAAFGQLVAGLPDELRASVEGKKHSDFNALVAHLDATEKFTGADKASLLKAPRASRDDAPEEWSAFNDQLGKVLGVPDAPEGYGEYKPPEGVTQALPEPVISAFYAKAHEAGGALASPEVVKGALDLFHQMSAEAEQTLNQGYEAETKAGREKLKAELGAAYDSRLNAGRQHLAALDGGEALTALLEASGLGDHPDVLRVTAALAAAMGEDGQHGGNGGGGGFQMTADAAKAELAKMEADPKALAALQSKGHPEHKVLTAKRQDLYRRAYPGA